MRLRSASRCPTLKSERPAHPFALALPFAASDCSIRLTGLANELGEMSLRLNPSVAVQHKLPLLEAMVSSPAHVARMHGAQGLALSIDNVGTHTDRELLPSSAAAQMKKAANVQYLLQDVYHVFNRVSETLRNSHKLYSLALWKLRTVRAVSARAARLCVLRLRSNPEQAVRELT